MGSTSELPKGGVRQGGKEELRASLLKTYLLRIRAEKGERAVRTILANAGIDPGMVDNETGWISTLAAKRALRRERADPARLVVDHARVDPGVREDRAHGALALLGTNAEQIRFEERRAQLLLAALAYSALRQLGRASHPTTRLPDAARTEKPRRS